jgi:hypothetical protein
VIQDFSRELVDVVPSAEELLFDVVIHGGDMTVEELRQIIKKRVSDDATVDIAIDVLIWMGCLGVKNDSGVTYISDCGFQRPYMRALLENPEKNSIVFHPVLTSVKGHAGRSLRPDVHRPIREKVLGRQPCSVFQNFISTSFRPERAKHTQLFSTAYALSQHLAGC